MVDNIGNCLRKVRMSVVGLGGKVIPIWPRVLYFISKCCLCCRNFLRLLRPSDMMLAVYQTLSWNQGNTWFSHKCDDISSSCLTGTSFPHLFLALCLVTGISYGSSIYTNESKHATIQGFLKFFISRELFYQHTTVDRSSFFHFTAETEAQKSNHLNEFDFENTWVPGKQTTLLIWENPLFFY